MRIIITFLALLFVSSPAFAGNAVVFGDGTVQIEKDAEIVERLTVSDEALAHLGLWQKAAQNPGVVVPVETVTTREPSGFFAVTETTQTTKGVLRTDDTIDVVGAQTPEVSKGYNPATVFGMVAIVLFTVVIILAWYTFAFAAAALAVAVAFAVAVAAAFAGAAFATFATAFAGAAFAAAFAGATAFAAETHNKKECVRWLATFVALDVLVMSTPWWLW